MSGWVRALLFDVDDTLFPSTEFARLAREKAVDAMIEMGLPSDRNRVSKALEKIISRKGSNSQNHFDLLVKALKVEPHLQKRIVAAGIVAYHNAKASIMPFPEVPRTLLSLRDKGYRLYAATDGVAVKQWDKLIRLGLAFFFEDVFVSEELKVSKSKAFYKKVVSKLGLKPEQVVVIGDRFDKDVSPARQVGCVTIRVHAGKYSNQKGKADFELDNFQQLPAVLKKLEGENHG